MFTLQLPKHNQKELNFSAVFFIFIFTCNAHETFTLFSMIGNWTILQRISNN